MQQSKVTQHLDVRLLLLLFVVSPCPRFESSDQHHSFKHVISLFLYILKKISKRSSNITNNSLSGRCSIHGLQRNESENCTHPNTDSFTVILVDCCKVMWLPWSSSLSLYPNLNPSIATSKPTHMVFTGFELHNLYNQF